MTVADGVQAIFGTRSENLKTDMERYLAGTGPRASAPTPTRAPASTPAGYTTSATLNAPSLLQALGGRENIASATNVANTRVRVQLKDARTLNTDSLMKQGLLGAQQIQPGLFHFIVGDQAANLAAELQP